jgi:hypothetical protein
MLITAIYANYMYHHASNQLALKVEHWMDINKVMMM